MKPFAGYANVTVMVPVVLMVNEGSPGIVRGLEPPTIEDCQKALDYVLRPCGCDGTCDKWARPCPVASLGSDVRGVR